MLIDDFVFVFFSLLPSLSIRADGARGKAAAAAAAAKEATAKTNSAKAAAAQTAQQEQREDGYQEQQGHERERQDRQQEHAFRQELKGDRSSALSAKRPPYERETLDMRLIRLFLSLVGCVLLSFIFPLHMSSSQSRPFSKLESGVTAPPPSLL